MGTGKGDAREEVVWGYFHNSRVLMTARECGLAIVMF